MFLFFVGTTITFADDLLEPLPDGTSEVPTGPDAILKYFSSLYPWALGLCGGLVVLWGVWSGILMIVSGGDKENYEKGKAHFQAAILGLLLLIFAGVILHAINPDFYQL